MTDQNGDAGCPSAAILRKLAASSRSPAELEALLAEMPFSEVQRLLNDLADALEAIHRGAGNGAEAPKEADISARSSLNSCAKPPETQDAPKSVRKDAPSRGQTSFGFGQQQQPEQSAAASQKAPAAQASVNGQSPAAAPRKLLLFSDGAARGNPGPSGAGAVLMLPDGKIVARLGKYLGIQTNNHAEYCAAILGLEAALRLGATEVEMIADSELLVKQVNGIYKVKNEHLKELWSRVRELMRRFDKATIRHVLRAYNKEADEMSNRAIDERM